MGMKVVKVIESRPRPFATHYYEHHLAVVGEYSKVGRAATELGAIRAAVVNVLRGKYSRADIYQEDGYKLFSVVRIKNQLTVHGLFKQLSFDK